MKRLEEVEIEDSGPAHKNLAFIKLKNGKILFGYSSDNVQQMIYRYLLGNDIKNRIRESAYNVAIDIAKRYLDPLSREHAYSSSKLTDIKEGDIIIEGGAYIGLYAMRLAEKVGESGFVLAVEAIKENFEVMKENINANGVKNIKYVNMGIWNKRENLQYYRSDKQAASYSKSVLKSDPDTLIIEVDTLDSIIEKAGIKKVDIVRLQTNGAELKGLEGMSQILATRPRLLIAAPYIVDGITMSNEIENFLKKKGFVTERRGESIYAS
ncbi:MAG: FkbM family methyltransferase [Saprospiraceae bacterium]|nr:FkbM family methyltransferase [Saprospiraceae bacterium]